jgi:hypothetical protein
LRRLRHTRETTEHSSSVADLTTVSVVPAELTSCWSAPG